MEEREDGQKECTFCNIRHRPLQFPDWLDKSNYPCATDVFDFLSSV